MMPLLREIADVAWQHRYEFALVALLGALAFRVRGGVGNEVMSKILGRPTDPPTLSTQGGRAFYALMLSAALGPIDPIQLIAVQIGLFAGCPEPWLTDTDRDCRTLKGFALMTARGLVFALPAAVIMWLLDLPWAPLLIAGLWCGPAYFLGARIPSTVHDLEQGAALGEALFGPALGLALHASAIGLLAFPSLQLGVYHDLRPHIHLIGEARGAPPENADPTLAPWFNSLRQPGTGVSCCSIADCRPVDYRGGPGGYEVWIDDAWHKVPPDKVLDGKDNPVGRAVVCYTPALGVLCFVRGTEA